jgi:hypothetical protein
MKAVFLYRGHMLFIDIDKVDGSAADFQVRAHQAPHGSRAQYPDLQTRFLRFMYKYPELYFRQHRVDHRTAPRLHGFFSLPEGIEQLGRSFNRARKRAPRRFGHNIEP